MARPTDIAADVGEVISRLEGHPSQNVSTIQVLAILWDFNQLSSGEQVEIVGALQARLRQLRDLSASLHDDDFGQDQKAAFLDGMSRTAQALSVQELAQSWTNTKALLRPGTSALVKSLSPHARNLQPLARVPDAERVGLLNSLTDLDGRIRLGEDDLGDVHRFLILASLSRLRFELTYLPFFGQPSMLWRAADAILTAVAVEKEATARDPAKPRAGTLLTLINVAVLITNVYSMPDRWAGATGHYLEGAQAVAQQYLSSPAPTPASIDADFEDVQSIQGPSGVE